MSVRQATFYDKDRDRWYRDPSNPSKTYPGVTSILNSRGVPSLEKAKRNGIIEFVARNRDKLEGLPLSGVRSLLSDQATVLPEWSVGMPFGSATHQVIQNIIEDAPLDRNVEHVDGTDSYPVSNTFTEWVPRLWGEFVKQFKVEILECEQTVVSDTFGFGGSFDLIVSLETPEKGRHNAIVDTKTNKSGPHASVAIQNKGYSKADAIMNLSTGERRSLPSIDASYVLWMQEFTTFDRPAWNLLPLSFDEHVWKIFYAHLLLFQFGKTEHEYMGDSLNGPDAFKRWIPRS